MMNVYFISGLGADERVFQFLNLPGINKTFIKWIAPEKNETLTAYSIRLSQQINTSEEVVLIGISFGGIIAQELAKIFSCKKVIIISSVKSAEEFSLSLSLVRFTQIHVLFPAWFLKWSNRFTVDYYFSTTSKQESRLLHQIIQDTDAAFLSWAIRQLMKWRNDTVNSKIIHIHGTKDRIFPIQPVKNAIPIHNGGHFMIINKAEEISAIIMQELGR